MKAIVGLGNPGPKYHNTRHNVGWLVIDLLCERWRAAKPVKARNAEISRVTVDGETLLLVKPLTFMNDSGVAVRNIVEKDGIAPEDIMVIYDDLDLACGRIRVRASGSSGGHNGIKSIQQHLRQARVKGQGSGMKGLGARLIQLASGRKDASDAAEEQPKSNTADFPRIKVGIGRPPAGVDPIDHVLTRFTPDERVVIGEAAERAASAVECWVREGIAPAMNKYNGS